MRSCTVGPIGLVSEESVCNFAETVGHFWSFALSVEGGMLSNRHDCHWFSELNI